MLSTNLTLTMILFFHNEIGKWQQNDNSLKNS